MCVYIYIYIYIYIYLYAAIPTVGCDISATFNKDQLVLTKFFSVKQNIIHNHYNIHSTANGLSAGGSGYNACT